jgi:LysM repeat protein
MHLNREKTFRLLVAGIFLITACAFTVSIQAESPNTSFYTVRGGDTLESLGKIYGIPWHDIAATNGLKHPYRLQIGQVLKIPRAKEDLQAVRTKVSTGEIAKVRALLKTNSAPLSDWRYIVIHHSATDGGNAKGFDEFHKERRKMAHGLAYHFVIDNGNGGGNGVIEVGNRWKDQWPGGHTSNALMNEIGIGICLVGNFEKSEPTEKQLRSLVLLCRLLQAQSNIPDRNVILHRHVAQRCTLCPGNLFPWVKVRRMLVGTKLS